ncbi:MAG: hypothetical protein ER33_05780 [Cyanobium sp. CACIAM 14]|nr:MAG: hypothetical protein ER33_05780 [Cyanobium sp. CACIAM 14]
MKRSLLAPIVALAGASLLLNGGRALAANNFFSVDLNKTFGDAYTGVAARMEFTFGGSDSAYTLGLKIINTSGSAINSSSLTGFAFDTPGIVNDSTLTYDRNGTNFYRANDSLTISPAPSFDFCASTDNNISNGTNCGSGSTAQGLAKGQDATVKFTFNTTTSTNLENVTSSFFSLFNQVAVNGNTADPNTVVLAARFQAINSSSLSDGSDKITGKPTSGPGPAPVDEVPGPLPWLGTAAAFSYSRRLRRRLARARAAHTSEA